MALPISIRVYIVICKELFLSAGKITGMNLSLRAVRVQQEAQNEGRHIHNTSGQGEVRIPEGIQILGEDNGPALCDVTPVTPLIPHAGKTSWPLNSKSCTRQNLIPEGKKHGLHQNTKIPVAPKMFFAV